jgi:hypothetical protein
MVSTSVAAYSTASSTMAFAGPRRFGLESNSLTDTRADAPADKCDAQNQMICVYRASTQNTARTVNNRRSACIALTVAFRRRSLIVAITGRSWVTATASPSCTLTMVSSARGRAADAREGADDRGHGRWREMLMASDR